jgi:hypothetical protein
LLIRPRERSLKWWCRVSAARIYRAAYARLYRAGLRVTFHYSYSLGGSWELCLPMVGRQFPRVGQRVAVHTVVTLQRRAAGCGAGSPAVPVGLLPSAKVPDFSGRSLSAATNWAYSRNLDWDADPLPPLRASAASSLFRNYTVVRQMPRPGRRLTLGIRTRTGSEGSFQPTPLQLRVRLSKRGL